MKSSTYKIVKREVPTLYFIGVTTGQSSIMRLFPSWAKRLGLYRAQIVGVDIPLRAPPEQYREAVAQVKYDPLSLGALVTTHKIDLLNAARDLFDELDSNAELCGEVSCIAKRDGRLIGLAKDPVTARLAMQAILETGYWKCGGHLLCFGAGGAAVSIVVNLMKRHEPAERPAHVTAVDILESQLDHLRTVLTRLPQTIETELVLSAEPRENDKLMGSLPEGSLVINATGMGKDRPGSPITDDGVFPERGIAWDLNYRGELGFVRQAQAQAEQRKLAVHDGWRYFLYNWTEVIAQVFDVKVSPEMFVSEKRP